MRETDRLHIAHVSIWVQTTVCFCVVSLSEKSCHLQRTRTQSHSHIKANFIIIAVVGFTWSLWNKLTVAVPCRWMVWWLLPPIAFCFFIFYSCLTTIITGPAKAKGGLSLLYTVTIIRSFTTFIQFDFRPGTSHIT